MMLRVGVVFAAVLAVSMTSASTLSDANVNEELVDLLLRLREKLDKDGAADARPVYRTLHDNVKVVRYRGMRTRGKEMKPSLRSGPGLTADQQTDLVNAINRARRNIQATDMYITRWNDKLADLAQQWSDQCEFIHGAPLFESSVIGFDEVGQNNYASTGPFSAADVVKDWLTEQPFYNLATDKCTGKSCDRFKQLAWSYATDVGCGLTACSGIGDIGRGNFVVCYFGPAGVYDGEKPYTAGNAPCTQCSHGQFYCNNGLCDSTCTGVNENCECKADCKNCGTQTSDCGCQCKEGAVGVDCSKLCGNFKDQCGKDWPKFFCSYDDFDWVRDMCPLMCSRCKYVADPCGGSQPSTPKPSTSGQGQAVPAANSPSTGGEVIAASPVVAPGPASGSGSQPAISAGGAIDPSQNLARGLTDAQKKRVISLHNYYRSLEGASDMNALVWNDELARIAQEWTDLCVFEHRALAVQGGHGYVDPASVGFPTSSLGENIWAFQDNSKPVPDDGIEKWYAEKNDYTFSTATCSSRPGAMCGHYIALVWAGTTDVGCGFTKCASVKVGAETWPGGVFLSCNYAPGADPAKQPFQVGLPCTECSSGRLYCTNSLCDGSCTAAGSSGNCECQANCVNGVKDSSTCSCKCNAGYMGGQCSAVCADKDSRCETDWAIRPELFCDQKALAEVGGSFIYDTVISSCPKLCGKCVPASRRRGTAASFLRNLLKHAKGG